MSGGDLDQRYNDYLAAETERGLSAVDSAHALDTESRRDSLWQEYLDAGGGRVAVHEVDQEAGRSDDFAVMSEGAEGKAVERLQTMLGMPERLQTGHFGPITRRRVKSLQRRQRLPHPDGMVGRATWSHLLSLAGEGDASDEAELRSYEADHDAAADLELIYNRRTGLWLPPELPQRWQLALDAVPQRTLANSYNMALLSLLAYSEITKDPTKDTAVDAFDVRLSQSLLRSQVLPFHDPGYSQTGKTWRPLLRPDTSPEGYRSEDMWMEHEDTDTQAFFIDHDAHVIISVRGTAGLTDVQQDLWSLKHEWPHAREVGHSTDTLLCPAGFYECFDGIRKNVHERMHAIHQKAPRRPVFLSGHSLGGAVAVLLACYLREQFPSHPIQLYTFGQPRSTDAAMARHYWSAAHGTRFNYYRFAHTHDPIPMVPSPRLGDDLAPIFEALSPWWGAGVIPRILAPADMDSRHFGTLVSCQNDDEERRRLVELSTETRQIEPAEATLAKNVLRYVDDAARHFMTGYLGHVVGEYERGSLSHMRRDGSARPPMAVPLLPENELHAFNAWVSRGSWDD